MFNRKAIEEIEQYVKISESNDRGVVYGFVEGMKAAMAIYNQFEKPVADKYAKKVIGFVEW